MSFVVVSNSEIRARGTYYLVKEFLKKEEGTYLTGKYDLDYLLYEDLDYLFFDLFYYKEYKTKFSKKNVKVKNLVLVSFDSKEADLYKEDENVSLICQDTNIDFLRNLEDKEDIFSKSDLINSRDKNILYLLSKGFTNKEIGKRLYLSEKTIKNNLTRIYKVLGVNGKYQAISLYLKNTRED